MDEIGSVRQRADPFHGGVAFDEQVASKQLRDRFSRWIWRKRAGEDVTCAHDEVRRVLLQRAEHCFKRSRVTFNIREQPDPHGQQSNWGVPG